MVLRMGKTLVATCFAACFFTFGTSCKEEEPPRGVVLVLDSAEAPVSGATVRLSSTGDKGAGILKGTGTTDGSGKAYFNEFTLPAILNVYAYKVKTAGDTLKGTGILRLEMDEENESKVTIK